MHHMLWGVLIKLKNVCIIFLFLLTKSPEVIRSLSTRSLLTRSDTWILGVNCIEAAKPASWPSLGLHHLGKFLEPSDEIAGRGCCCFLVGLLLWWHSWAFGAHQEWALETWRTQILNLSVLTLWCLQIFWQRVVQPRSNHRYLLVLFCSLVLGCRYTP